MKFPVIGAVCAGCFMMTVSVAATSALLDRGGGLIYDTDLDITWLQDANYAATSGHSPDGRMTWGEAQASASNLTFCGFDDWRLPKQPDPTLA